MAESSSTRFNVPDRWVVHQEPYYCGKELGDATGWYKREVHDVNYVSASGTDGILLYHIDLKHPSSKRADSFFVLLFIFILGILALDQQLFEPVSNYHFALAANII